MPRCRCSEWPAEMSRVKRRQIGMKRRSGVTARTGLKRRRPTRVGCPRMRRKIKQHVPAIAPATRARSLTIQTAQKAKRAKLELIVLVPLMAITVTAYLKREEL